jgi:hypothetical protein
VTVAESTGGGVADWPHDASSTITGSQHSRRVCRVVVSADGIRIDIQ